jgi:hypothetical protein
MRHLEESPHLFTWKTIIFCHASVTLLIYAANTEDNYRDMDRQERTMNSSYQVNKFFAQERMNAHLKAARAHRLAQKANSEKSYRSSLSIAAAITVRVYRWTGRVMNQMALGVKRLGKANVSARYPRLR